MQNSSSEWGVYSTNGEQLAGELAGCNELAHQFDKKCILFYVEVSGTGVLVGTRLIVQIVGGREERAIFLKKYSLSAFSLIDDRTYSFYSEAKTAVENLTQIHYRVLGLLKEGDLPLVAGNIDMTMIQALTGKVLAEEEVKIKIEDLSISFGALKKIITSFNEKKILSYKIAIAQYPVDVDILISPNVSEPDLEISPAGQEKVLPCFAKNQLFFEALFALYARQYPTLTPSERLDRDNLSRILKKSLLTSELMNKILQSTPEQVQDILFIYRNDAEALYQIVKRGGTSPAPLDSIKPEIIAVVTGYIIESVESPGPGEREILKKGYQQGNEDLKNKIRLYLTSKGIVDEYYLSDLWHASIQSRDIQLLQSLVKNTKIKDPDMQKLKNTLPSVTFEQPQVLSFIELVLASGFDKEGNGKGNQLYQEIIEGYIINRFNTKKLNQLQDRFGRIQNPAPAPSRIDLKTAIIIILIVLAILGLIVSMLGYFGVITIIPAGNQTTNAVPTIQQGFNSAPGELLPGSGNAVASNATNGSS